MGNKKYKTMKEQVRKWMEIAQVKLSKESVSLYMKLIEEEFNELKQAYEDGNYAEMADACIDLPWVIYGQLISMQVDIDRAQDEVTKSNFSKFVRIKASAVGAQELYAQKGIETYVDEVEYEGEKYYIVRRSLDNKILKPASYSPPDWKWLIPPDYF